jgi:hypothetical protein
MLCLSKTCHKVWTVWSRYIVMMNLSPTRFPFLKLFMLHYIAEASHHKWIQMSVNFILVKHTHGAQSFHIQGSQKPQTSSSLSKPMSAVMEWLGVRGSAVVKALCYKPEGRGFNSRWGHWIFSIDLILPAALVPGVYSASNRNENFPGE